MRLPGLPALFPSISASPVRFERIAGAGFKYGSQPALLPGHDEDGADLDTSRSNLENWRLVANFRGANKRRRLDT